MNYDKITANERVFILENKYLSIITFFYTTTKEA